MLRWPLLALLLLSSCRAPDPPTVRADDAAPCNCASCPPPAKTVASAIPLDLPSTGEAQAVFTVAISAAGDLQVDGKKAVLGDVEPLAAAAVAAHSNLRAVVAADKDCKHGLVIAVVDQLRQAGIAKVGFAVDKLPPP